MGIGVRAVLAAGLLVALTACGGGSGSGNGNASSTTFDLWTGTFDTDVAGGPNKVTVYGAIEPGKLAMFFDDAGDVYVFPNSAGDSSFTGSIFEVAPPGGFVDNFGDTELLFTIAEASTINSAITGTWSGGFGSAGSFALQPYQPSVTTASIVPGVWNGVTLHQSTATRITMAANGSFTGTDDLGCSLTGKLSQPDPTDDHFDVTLHSTGKSICSATFKGLAFETDTDIDGEIDGGTGHYYYLFVTGAGQSRMIGFKAP